MHRRTRDAPSVAVALPHTGGPLLDIPGAQCFRAKESSALRARNVMLRELSDAVATFHAGESLACGENTALRRMTERAGLRLHTVRRPLRWCRMACLEPHALTVALFARNEILARRTLASVTATVRTALARIKMLLLARLRMRSLGKSMGFLPDDVYWLICRFAGMGADAGADAGAHC
jgi:hypothetical protein